MTKRLNKQKTIRPKQYCFEPIIYLRIQQFFFLPKDTIVHLSTYLCPKSMFCAKRANKIIVPPQEMLLSFSIGTFSTNYDVTSRKPQSLQYLPVYEKNKNEREISQWRPLKYQVHNFSVICFFGPMVLNIRSIYFYLFGHPVSV